MCEILSFTQSNLKHIDEFIVGTMNYNSNLIQGIFMTIQYVYYWYHYFRLIDKHEIKSTI